MRGSREILVEIGPGESRAVPARQFRADRVRAIAGGIRAERCGFAALRDPAGNRRPMAVPASRRNCLLGSERVA